MGKKTILAVDFGTTGVKTYLFTRELTEVAHAYAEYETSRPQATFAEQDPEHWWWASKDTLGQLVQSGRLHVDSIAGVGISSHYPSVLPVDREGNPLLPAQIWMDERGESQCAFLEACLQNAKRIVNGNKVRGFYPLPKILWIKENLPTVFDRTHKFLQVSGYIGARLTGRFAIDHVSASWFHNYDFSERNWNEDISQALGLPLDMLPDIQESYEVLGSITPLAAEETGLVQGTPVIVGTGDAVAAALGAGVVTPGQGYLTMGTGSCVSVITSEPRFSPQLITESYVQPSLWVVEGVMKTTGATLKWFRDQIGQPELAAAETVGVSAYELMDCEARRESPGSGGLIFLPYMAGEQSPIDDAKARGVIFGLSLTTRRAQLIRMVMEGSAYAIRDNIEAIEALGVKVTELRVTGGPTRSDVWNQILADVTGKTITIPTIQETAPLGVAILVARGLGVVDDLVRPARDVSATRARFNASPEHKAVYDKLYPIYKSLYESLRGDFVLLDQAVQRGF